MPTTEDCVAQVVITSLDRPYVDCIDDSINRRLSIISVRPASRESPTIKSGWRVWRGNPVLVGCRSFRISDKAPAQRQAAVVGVRCLDSVHRRLIVLRTLVELAQLRLIIAASSWFSNVGKNATSSSTEQSAGKLEPAKLSKVGVLSHSMR